MIDRWAISYAPSASSLAQMEKVAGDRAGKGALLMSNPFRPDSGSEFPDLPGAPRLIAQLQRNELGVPEWPTTTTIAARWVEGPSLRKPAGEVKPRGASPP